MTGGNWARLRRFILSYGRAHSLTRDVSLMDKMLFADTARFPHETIDGETVLVDSELGHLFLFTGLGPWLWQRMALGGTVEEVVGEIVAKFGAEAESHAPFSRDAQGSGSAATWRATVQGLGGGGWHALSRRVCDTGDRAL